MEKEKLIALVTAAQKGDGDAANELFNAFYNDFYYFALKTVRDDDLALDITQEAFVEIIKTINKLNEPAAFVTWAKQIVYHQCTRHFRKKTDITVDEDEDGNNIFDTLKEENAEFIPDEALDQDDFKKTILNMVESLPEEQRAAVMMFYFDEMSIREIAEIQSVSENTIKSRLNYGRKAIKEAVETYEKKNGIKLHAVPFLPLFKWLFAGSFKGGISAASAAAMAEGISATTGVTVTATVAVAGGVATTAGVAAATAGAVGLGAKIAALPIAIKIISGIVAAAVAVGGIAAAVAPLTDKDEQPANNSSTTAPSSDKVSSDIVSSDNSSKDDSIIEDTSSEESSTEDTSSGTVSDDTAEDEQENQKPIYNFAHASIVSRTDYQTNESYYVRYIANLTFHPEGGVFYNGDEDVEYNQPVLTGDAQEYVLIPRGENCPQAAARIKEWVLEYYDGTWDDLFEEKPDYYEYLTINGEEYLLVTDLAMGGGPTPVYSYTINADGTVNIEAIDAEYFQISSVEIDTTTNKRLYAVLDGMTDPIILESSTALEY